MAKLTLKEKRKESWDMWYVIQTMTGKEQNLVDAIGNVFNGNRDGNKEELTYKRCFVLMRECIWRIEGQLRVHIEPLFPSYVFVETDDPDAFFIALKEVPKLAKLLGSEGSFWSINAEEEQFLSRMTETEECKEPYLVRRSLVRVDSEGRIVSAEGVLKHYMGQIVKQRLRKRSVIIEVPFMGELRRIQLGIRLTEDAAT